MKSYILSFLFILFFCPISAMEKSEIQIHQAYDYDIQQIIQLMNNHAIEDCNKRVIVLEKFRESAIHNDVTKNRLYVAKDPCSNNVIAFKKFFIVTDPQEFTDIIEQEICCAGSKGKLVAAQCYIESNIINMIDMPNFS